MESKVYILQDVYVCPMFVQEAIKDSYLCSMMLKIEELIMFNLLWPSDTVRHRLHQHCCKASSHDLHQSSLSLTHLQCWIIINWTLGNKFKWILNHNCIVFFQENVFENVICLNDTFFSANALAINHNNLFENTLRMTVTFCWSQLVNSSQTNLKWLIIVNILLGRWSSKL